jgi:hypothetical protein
MQDPSLIRRTPPADSNAGPESRRETAAAAAGAASDSDGCADGVVPGEPSPCAPAYPDRDTVSARARTRAGQGTFRPGSAGPRERGPA